MAFADPLTIDDFERLPDALALNHELVDGELVDAGGNPYIHNSLRDSVMCIMREHVEENAVGMVISGQAFEFGGDVLAPDVSFFENKKIPIVEWRHRVQRFVPDLAVEIVSQNDTFARLVQKADRYRKCGTQEAWILDVDSRRALLFSPNRNEILSEDQQFASALIPGFSIRIGDLFDRR